MNKVKKLQQLKKKMAEDDLPLKGTANNLVFGEGNVDAEILFIGEGPGHWEDVKGRPFVGNAGAFLNQMCREIGIKREEGMYSGGEDEYFITNIIHYRAPNNRDPEPEEIKAFQPYLDKIISIVDPKVIVTLGRFSMGKFLKNVMISRVHGKPRVIDWMDKRMVVVPMYHPAAGLRNGDVKRQTMEDFRNLPGILKEAESSNRDEEEKEKSEQMSFV